jgi:hypothetical protein
MNEAARLRHVAASSGSREPRIHLLALDGDATMCGGVRANEVRSGTVIQRLFPTELPVTCTSCVKALEMTVRHLIQDFRDPGGMERIYNTVVTARLESRPENLVHPLHG